jgi:SAM-dependent methyltransferase
MALSAQALGAFCNAANLRPHASASDVFVYRGVDPYRSEGITRQFLQDAAGYHERYFKPTRYSRQLQRAFQRADFHFDSRSGLQVLDLGSGSGNTVLPLVGQNPSIKLVATDLSIDLLLILAGLVRDQDCRDQIGFICADANQKIFHDGVFDLVVGSAILHHLLQPAEAIAHALACLKPGGVAVFFEPFEYGCNLLKTLYHFLLDEPRVRQGLHPDVAAHFLAMIRDYNARFDVEAVKPFTKYLDDKWLFTRRFFAEACHRNGCQLVDILNNREDSLAEAFTSQVLENLQLTGLGDHPLPDRLMEICREFDRSLSLDLRRQLLVDGVVVIRK